MRAENFFPHEEAYNDSDVNQIDISMVNIFCASNVPHYSLTSAAQKSGPLYIPAQIHLSFSKGVCPIEW